MCEIQWRERSISQRIEWLAYWLRPILTPLEMVVRGRTYHLIKECRIAFFVHTVFYDVLSKEYIWYMIVNHTVDDTLFYRMPRFPTYRAMMEYVASMDVLCPGG